MNAHKELLGGLLLASIVASCGTGNNSQISEGLDNCPVVGTFVEAGSNKVLSCDQKLLTDTVFLPLSHLTEELEVIKLDNREEALVGQSGLTISDHYILTHRSGQIPFRLFDRKGNYLTNIGAIGQGPGEYQNVYDAQLDEANNRIYLLPWQSGNILVYDLSGKVLPPIPICLRAPKGKFYVDAHDSTVAVTLLPFKGLPAVAWTQDMQGNRKAFIEPGHLEAPQDFSNEITSSRNVPSVFDVNILCIVPTREDSLYHYDYKNNRLNPVFTMKFSLDPIPWHGYMELPGYYMGDTSLPIQVKENAWEAGETVYYIIEKHTGKGAYLRLLNDYLGNTEIAWPIYSFNNGYYARSVEPGNLQTELETALKDSNLTDEMRKKLTGLQSSVGENDNNYIFVARLKR